MSIKVILELNAKPESIEELTSTLKNILPDTRSYDGCIDSLVTINQDDALNLILIENWESRQKFETYFAWRQETGAVEALGQLLSQAPSIRFYDNQDI